ETTMLPALRRNSSSPGSPIRKSTSPFRRRRSRNEYHSSRRTGSSTSWKRGTWRRNAISGKRCIRPAPGARDVVAVRGSRGPSLQHDALQRVRALLRRDMRAAPERQYDDGALLGRQLVVRQHDVGIADELAEELPVDHHAPDQILDRLACHGSIP